MKLQHLVKVISWPCKTMLVSLITLYRFTISPFIGYNCRFEPSCSLYAEEAIRRHGVFYGACFSIIRIVKCHPWHPGGCDPVPDSNKKETL